MQFVKYVFCGGISVFVDQAVFYLLAWLAFPALRLSDPVARLIVSLGFSVQDVSFEQLKVNYWIIKVFCFIISNSVVYLLNVLFVFRGGRHKRPVEVAMFFGFSLFQFFYIWLGSLLIDRFGWEVTYANLSMLVLGIATNYVARKKIVFKG
ncbi:GtrA family protein [Pontiellaceae bacterium B12219]|nr:GtrA family protein [Pontiellaceae bacterium B12219]